MTDVETLKLALERAEKRVTELESDLRRVSLRLIGAEIL
jgi:hypothetical protein